MGPSDFHGGGNAPSPLRVCIYYMESTGAGHRRAAEAVDAALRALPEPVEVQRVNIVDYMNPAVHQVYQTVRNWLMDDAPHVFGQLYAWSDRPPEKENIFEKSLRGLELTSLRSLIDFMVETPCDLAIHTHFFPAEVAAFLRRRGRVHFPHVTVTTDYFSHALWSQDPCERFFVASGDAKAYLSRLGVPLDRIERTGIPIDPRFAALRKNDADFDAETEARIRAFESEARRPRVLLSATGTAPEAATQNLQDLLMARRPLSVRVLAGGDSDRLDALRQVPVPPDGHVVEVCGPRDDMPEVLAESDVVIGKAGGLTCAESMSAGCPMAFLRPRPDQEAQNVDFLLEHQAATRIFRSALLGPKIDAMFADLERWRSLRTQAHRLGQPEAASQVARACMELVRLTRGVEA